ncbi:neuronal tyrosine-phosphorylated phosphoinositide-3-kinase adapter 2-like [Thalassophryne amazonica]|uniref:neuronal tyrosine-phosphorylated phosphoinositide-3-kinase adapter 2-like n=1 Tax=Thalassophryne amazonica TaxID=390379 RepID=UPI00147152BB|nr:neuronal tyrosine-phosphorylated phosphoinositide-3-kinase adapter 2-like [Thalassophryne amazonica]
MTSQQEALSFQRFLQYVEDSGLHVYDDLVIQNASDISRESDRIRNQTNWTYQQEKHQKKRRQEDTIKRIGEDVSKATEGSYAGKHFRIGFMTMPAPQDRVAPPIQGFAVRSQSLHSVGVADDDSNHSRKQPPPKPRRDPNTKLSNSSEMVNGGSSATKNPRDTNKSPQQIEARSHLNSEEFKKIRSHLNSEEFKKIPPPKPRRNPNTQLSSSFDESYIHNYGNRKCSLQLEKSSSQSQSPASQDTDDDEPVYIEMVGNILQDLKGQDSQEDDQNESVYEEMKYPVPEEFLQDPGLDSNPAIMVPDSWSSTWHGSSCNIPPPFPNLLAHHPPLLIFPSAPTQCSPNSDESPLTPLDVFRLPMLEHVGAIKSGPAEVQQHWKERDQERGQEFPSSHTITSSGRSSAPPLSSSSSHMAHVYPRSQSACPSPVSMSHSLTPVNLKRPPPYETLTAGGSTRRLSSSMQVTQEGLTKLSDLTSSTQNVLIGSQIPPSPREDQTIPSMTKKGSGHQKNRETEGSVMTISVFVFVQFFIESRQSSKIIFAETLFPFVGM